MATTKPKKKREPKPAMAGVTELSRILQLSRTNIYKHLGKVDAPKPKDGKYDIEEVTIFIADRQKKDTKVSGDGEYAIERILKTRAERQMKELEYQKSKGELVEVSEVVAWINAQWGGIRQRISSLPSVLTPLVHRKKRADIQKIISAELNRMLDEYAKENERHAKKIEQQKRKHDISGG